MNHDPASIRGRRGGPFRFTPGDDTQPPLIHVPITKEEQPMAKHRQYDPEFRVEACDRLEAGESLTQVSAEMDVPIGTLAGWPRRRATEAGSVGVDTPPQAGESEERHGPGHILADGRGVHTGGLADADAGGEHVPPWPSRMPTRLNADPAFRVVLDPESANRELEEAMSRWLADHFTTSFDGVTLHAQVPPIPTRWVVQAQVIHMEPEEDAP